MPLKESIKTMTKHTLILPVLLAGGLISYLGFYSFQPQVPQQSQNVQGAYNAYKAPAAFPQPMGAQKLAQTKTDKTESITLKTDQNAQKIQDFYKISMIDADWELDYESETDPFYEAQYEKGEDKAKITIIQEEQNNTIITVDIRYNK